ncbi:MAG: integration host factor, partial [Candidatus Rokuibacteriota bacterium]
MAKSMTKSAIITHLSQKTGLTKKQIGDVMDQL